MSFPATTTEGPLNTQNWLALSSFLVIGVGDPEGAVKGRIGAIFLRTDGEAGTTLYAKESGEGTDEGWGAVNSPITSSDLAASAKELFPQLPASGNVKVLWGRVTEAGAKAGGAEGWTVEKVEAGKHKVKFSPAFATIPAVVFSLTATSSRLAIRTENVGTTEFNVIITDLTFALKDAAWHFQAIG